jgi:murein tripeptide amidase MpaA
MRRRRVLQSIGGATAAGVILSGQAAANDCPDDFIIPGGPFPPEQVPENYESFTSNEGVIDQLEDLDRRSNVEYEVVAETLEGRPIPYVRLGNGDIDLFIVTQQHGDEQHATEAALRYLRSNGNGNPRGVFDEVTLHMLPRVNPDGWAPADNNETPTRANADGVDPNRQHDYEPGSDDNPSPEAQAMLDTVDAVDADMVVDIHNQFTYRSDDCELINTSVFWPINDAAPQDAVDLSRQMCAHLYQETDQQHGHTVFDTYPGGTDASIARNAYGIQGRGSVLIEQRGQAPELNNVENGKLVRIAQNLIEALVDGAASGDLFEIDPDAADDIPPRGEGFWKDLPREEWGPDHEAYTE